MKKMAILLILLLGAVVVGLAGCKATRAGYESAPYKVVRHDGKFELRDYPSLTVVETPMAGGGSNGADGSFNRLFRFITGNNEADQKIAMTTPIFMSSNETNRAMVRKIIGTLTHREQAVLYSRFGLNGHDPKNLEEVGKELNITDDRVRQIQNAAFVKLRYRLKNLEPGVICEEGGNGNIR